MHVRVLNECEFSLHDLLSVFPIKLLCFFLHSGLKAHFVVKLPIILFRLHLVWLMTAANQKSCLFFLSSFLFDPFISLRFCLHNPLIQPDPPLPASHAWITFSVLFHKITTLCILSSFFYGFMCTLNGY